MPSKRAVTRYTRKKETSGDVSVEHDKESPVKKGEISMHEGLCRLNTVVVYIGI